MGDIIRILIIVGFILFSRGLTGVIDFFKDIVYATCEFLKMINIILIEFYDQSILAYMFSHRIVFYIVGLISGIFVISKSKFGKYTRKTLYKIIMNPILHILNWLGKNLI